MKRKEQTAVAAQHLNPRGSYQPISVRKGVLPPFFYTSIRVFFLLLRTLLFLVNHEIQYTFWSTLHVFFLVGLWLGRPGNIL